MTAPLVPSYVNLRMFEDMPLAVVRLRDSALASTPNAEAFRCSMLLFCSSWHQVPAGSLPNSEVELAKLAGLGRSVREWRKVSDETLRGWIKCDDGRLYHAVVAEKALEAWKSHVKSAHRWECDRLRKAAQRLDIKAHYPNLQEFAERYQASGITHWDELLAPTEIQRTEGDDPQEIQRKTPRTRTRTRSEQEQEVKPSVDTSLHTEESPRPADDLARALACMGYAECSGGHPDLVAAKAAGVTVDGIKAATIGKVGKSVTYIARRAIGQLRDATESSAGAPAAKRVDPVAAAAAEAAREIDDRRRIIANDFRLGLITEEERERRMAKLLGDAAVEAIS